MESRVSPANIEERAGKLAEAAKPEAVKTEAAKVEPAAVEKVEPKVEAKVEAKVEPKVEAKVEAKVEPKVEAKVEPKVEAKVEPAKAPNDPAELRKWNTKVSQDNAELRAKMANLEAAIAKLSKKPVDYAALAKDPEALQKHIEAEREEASKAAKTELSEAKSTALRNETLYEKARRENDKTNYPRWEKLFPLIQSFSANTDGRINFNQAPGDVLDDLYKLADSLSPAEAAAVVPAPVVPAAVVPAAGLTQADLDAAVAKAKTEARAEAEAALRAEANGAGIGSAGKGGRRDPSKSNEALKTMPLGELKKLISKE